MTRSRVVLLIPLVVAVGVLAVAAVLGWEPVVWILLGSLIAVGIALQVDNRRSISRRVRNAGLRVERQLTTHRNNPPPWLNAGQSVQRRPDLTAPSPAAQPAWPTEAPGGGIAAAATEIVASGVFDTEFYSAQADWPFTSDEQAVRHYLAEGRAAGYLPHPLFSPAVVDPNRWHQTELDPLLRYLRAPDWSRSASTSHLFDPQFLDDADLPEQETPLAWFLRTRVAAPLPADPALFGPTTLDDLRERLVVALTKNRATQEQSRTHLGAGQAPEPETWVSDAVETFRSGGSHPLVSIVLPTWNRAGTLRAAIESVQAQNYPHWELLVADDGSTDDTALVLRAEASRDDRIVPLILPHQGVSAARNAALGNATGTYVAFLDSDKTWDPDFLTTMVAVLESGEHEAAVAACEISVDGRTFYRSIQPTVDSLRVGNTVDQTALVARRARLTSVGGFNESLRRAVDYDLVLRLAEVCHLQQVPFVGVRYSEDHTDPTRISEFESKAWNFYVSDRAAWERHRAEPPQEHIPGLLSVIIDDVRSPSDVRAVLSEAVAAGGPDLEIILIPHRNDWWRTAALTSLELARVPVRVQAVGRRVDRPSYVNQAIREARGEHTLILDARQRVLSGRLTHLIEHLSAAAVVHPVVLGDSRLLADAGVIYAEHGTDPIPFLRHLPPDILLGTGAFAVPGAPFPLLARTQSLLAVEGLNARLGSLWADIDLSQRLAQETGLPICTTPDVVVQTHGTTWSQDTSNPADDVRTFRALWPRPPAGSAEACAAVGVTAHVEGFTSISIPNEPTRWTRADWIPGRTKVSERPAGLRWALRTAAPADERADNWGDWHYANSLADALRRLGQQVHVDFQPNALRPTSSFEDVVVNLRGLRAIPLPAGATSVLWVISHPEQVSAKELAAYDLRYAASSHWSTIATQQSGLSVKTLLQCTDPGRFHPDDEHIGDLAESIVMVGNSRKEYRPAAWQAAHAGLPVRIWGTDWEDQVPSECIMGANLPNEGLRRYYQSAAWVLNDHWPQMREDGFLSNRIFDVLASGGRLVTDDVTGLAEVFGDQLQVFHSPVDLLEILRGDPRVAYPAHALERLSAVVRREHTFDVRATRLLDDVQTHRAVSARP